MATWQEQISGWQRRGVPAGVRGGRKIVQNFGDVRAEYEALAGAAIVDRHDRGLLEITGADRAAWLHNLATNQITPLQPSEGNYAFFCNVQGRILFDAVVLVRPDACWLDIDRSFLESATKHLDKYIITEDVSIADRSSEFARFGLCGVNCGPLFGAMNAAQVGNLPCCGHVNASWHGKPVVLARTDFCGVFGVDAYLPAEDAVAFWDFCCDATDRPLAVPAGDDAVEVRRVEAGLPAAHAELREECLPAETGQFDRAVNYHKGCYLGQEVVERMRSRNVVARLLTGIETRAAELPPTGADVLQEGKPVGKVTSARHSFVFDAPLALAFVRFSAAGEGTELTIRTPAGSHTGIARRLPLCNAPAAAGRGDGGHA